MQQSCLYPPLPTSGPRKQGYNFHGMTRFDKLFRGVFIDPPAFMKQGDVRGTEDIGFEGTLDADYGRLLERAYDRGLATLVGFEPTIFTLKG